MIIKCELITGKVERVNFAHVLAYSNDDHTDNNIGGTYIEFAMDIPSISVIESPEHFDRYLGVK